MHVINPKNINGAPKVDANDPSKLLAGASTDNVTGKTIDPNSYGANVGGVTPAPTVNASNYGTMGSAPNKVSTYGEFLTSKEAMAKSTYDSTVKRLDDLNAETLAKIESDRQKGVRNAGNAYEQNKASYGSNAEALRRMGLSGSGYSDYLESSAYAASRSEIGAINAGATESARAANSETEKNKFDALNTYNANISEIASERAKFEESERLRAEEEDAAKKTAFQTLLTNINSGIYTDYDQIQKLAADAGLSAEEAQQLVNSAAQFDAKDKAATSYELMSDDEKNSVAGIQAAIDAGAITHEAGVAKLDKMQKDTYNTYLIDFTDSANISDVMALNIESDHENGLLSDTQYDALKAKFIKSIDTDDNFFARGDGSGYMSKAEATAAMKALVDTGWIKETDQTYKDIKAAFNKRYDGIKDVASNSIITIDEKTKYHAGVKQWVGEFNTYDASYSGVPIVTTGKNIQILQGEKGTIRKLEIANEVGSPKTLDRLRKADLVDYKIYGDGKNLFMKKGDRYYYISGRGGKKTTDYDIVLGSLAN